MVFNVSHNCKYPKGLMGMYFKQAVSTALFNINDLSSCTCVCVCVCGCVCVCVWWWVGGCGCGVGGCVCVCPQRHYCSKRRMAREGGWVGGVGGAGLGLGDKVASWGYWRCRVWCVC